MESFENALGILDPQWSSRIKSILVDPVLNENFTSWPNVVSAFAFINSASEDCLNCELGYHEPFVGPKLIHPTIHCTLNIPPPHDFLGGTWIGFCNAIVVARQPPRLHLDQKSAIWNISTLETSCPTVVGHMFSGAFSGWERAFNWCKVNKINKPMFSYAIDSDPMVGRIWASHENVELFRGFVPLNFKTSFDNVMINTTIQDKSWYNLNRFVANLLMTASPPCQSWSLGGKKTGLHSENGMSFIDCINSARWVRPVAIMLECSDQVPHHSHFAVITMCFSFAGYKHHWSQIISLDELTGMNRTRWLGVWLRNDVFPKDVPPPVKLAQVSPHFWNDDECRFYIPAGIKQQLCLNDELLGLYGNPELLPPSKKVAVGGFLSTNQVLQIRCLRDNDKMPTLCAQYSKQHGLNSLHLQNKGIFASLMLCDEKFMFIDPLRFVNLLGNPKDQKCVVSGNIDDAFHHLGNAISVQHALLGIKIALMACGFDKAPLLETIMQSWQSRMTTSDVIIITKDDFVCMTPISQVSHSIEEAIAVEHDNTGITIKIGEKLAKISRQCSFQGLFNRIGIYEIEKQNIKVVVDHSKISSHDLIINSAGKDIVVKKGDQTIFSIQVPFEIAFPTQPWNPIQEEEESIKDEEILKHINEIEANHDEKSKCESETAIYYILGNGNPNNVSIPKQCDDVVAIQTILHSIGIDLTPDQVQWFRPKTSTRQSHTLVFVIDLHFLCKHPNQCVFVQCASEMTYPIVVSSEIAPKTVAQRCNIRAETFHIDEKALPMSEIIKVSHGDTLSFNQEVGYSYQVEHASKRPKIDHEPEKCEFPIIPMRWRLMQEFGPKLGSDEMTFFLNKIRTESTNQQLVITDLCVWNGKIDFILFTKLTQFAAHIDSHKTLVCPVLVKDHWGAIELQHTEHGLSLRAININSGHGREFIKRISRAVPAIKSIRHFLIPAIDGFCGWALLQKWSQIAEIEIPEPTISTISAKISECFGTNLPWGRVSGFAFRARCLFMSQNPQCENQTIHFGGSPDSGDASMAEDSNGKTEKTTDPWLKYDPWSNKQKQCRWEDLSLPSDHPFHDKHDQRIVQVHRHALNANNNGIAFCTRAAVGDILSKKPKQPFALVVPASDKVSFQPPQGTTVSDPQEIIVQDGMTGNIYKRQILLVQNDSQVQVKMPKPGFTTTLTEKHEIVLEMHSNLLPKETMQLLGDKHLEVLKARAYDQFSSLQRENANIYGFRKFQDPTNKEKITYQAMCKVTKETRVVMLETSGAGEVFVRDFISKGMQPTDTTIIPKFWACDRQGKDEALRSSASVDGFAGIVVTRRGIATRAWCNRISNVRKVLLADDERICDLNRSVVPHHMFNSTGWPLSIGPQDIVKVVKQTCGLPPIPTRCFKILGVTTWTLGFDSIPTILKFTAQFNGTIHEILLTKVEEHQSTKKQTGSFNKFQSSKPARNQNELKAVPLSSPADERLTSLETKVAAMERRQDGMEHKLQTGFDGIQDQLRQVLNAVQPRPASPRATGFTPPPEVAKST